MVLITHNQMLYDLTKHELEYTLQNPEISEDVILFMSEGGFTTLTEGELVSEWRKTFTDLDQAEFRKAYKYIPQPRRG
jgi:hypothetical protein